MCSAKSQYIQIIEVKLSWLVLIYGTMHEEHLFQAVLIPSVNLGSVLRLWNEEIYLEA